MSDLILHHYGGSPFAHKIIRILGFKGLPWNSVAIPPVLPRPLLSPLTGGYRRTPVLQSGADLYFDTRCIARFIERLRPEPTLWPEGSRALSDAIAYWMEPRVFVAMAPLRFRGVEDVEGVFAGSVDAPTFLADRTPFMAGALDTSRTAELLPASCDQVRSFLAVLDAALEDGRAFLAGSAPSVADFSAGLLVWWLERPPRVRGMVDGFGRVARWFEILPA